MLVLCRKVLLTPRQQVAFPSLHGRQGLAYSVRAIRTSCELVCQGICKGIISLPAVQMLDMTLVVTNTLPEECLDTAEVEFTFHFTANLMLHQSERSRRRQYLGMRQVLVMLQHAFLHLCFPDIPGTVNGFARVGMCCLRACNNHDTVT